MTRLPHIGALTIAGLMAVAHANDSLAQSPPQITSSSPTLEERERFAVEDATRGREFEHRLKDFNNLPETSLEDVKRVLRVARERVQSRLRSQ